MASVVPGDREEQTEEDKHEGRSRSPSKYLCVLG